MPTIENSDIAITPEEMEKQRRKSMEYLKRALRNAERNHPEQVESYRAMIRRLEENEQRKRRLNGRKGVSRPCC